MFNEEEFKKDLQEVLVKHEVALFAIPNYTQDKDGRWGTSAEIKIVPTPKDPVPLPKEDIIK